MPSSIASGDSYQSLTSEYENDIMTVPPIFQDFFDEDQETPAVSLKKKTSAGTKIQRRHNSEKKIHKKQSPDKLYRRSESKEKRKRSDSEVIKQTITKSRSKDHKPLASNVAKIPSKEVTEKKLLEQLSKVKETQPKKPSKPSASPQREESGTEDGGSDASSVPSKTPASSQRPSESTIVSEKPATKKASNQKPKNQQQRIEEKVVAKGPDVKSLEKPKDTGSNGTVDTDMAKLTMDLMFDPIKRKDPEALEIQEQNVNEEIQEEEQGTEIDGGEEGEEGEEDDGEEGNDGEGEVSVGHSEGQDETMTVAEDDPNLIVLPENPILENVGAEETKPQPPEIKIPEKTNSERINTIIEQREESAKRVPDGPSNVQEVKNDPPPRSLSKTSHGSNIGNHNRLSRTGSSHSNAKQKPAKPLFPKIKTKEEKIEEEKQALKDDYKKFNPLSLMEEEQLNEQEQKKLMAKKREIRWFLYQMQNSGIPVSKKFTLDDDLEEMKFEAKKLKDQWNLKNSSRSTWTLFMTANKIIEIILQKIDPDETEWSKWANVVESNRKEYMASIRSIHRKKLGYYESNPKVKLFRDFGTQAASFFGPLIAIKLLRWGKKSPEVAPPVAQPIVEPSSNIITEKIDKKMEELQGNISKMQASQSENVQEQKALTKQMEELTQMFKIMIMRQQASYHQHQKQQQEEVEDQFANDHKTTKEEPKVEYVTTYETSDKPPKHFHPNVQVTIPRDMFSNPYGKQTEQHTNTNSQSNSTIVLPNKTEPRITEIPIDDVEEQGENKQESESEFEIEIIDEPKQTVPSKEDISQPLAQPEQHNIPKLNTSYVHDSVMKVPSMTSLMEKNSGTSSPASTQPKVSMIDKLMKIDPNTTTKSPNVKLVQSGLGTLNPILQHLRSNRRSKRNDVPDDYKVYSQEDPPTPPQSDSESDDSKETNTTVHL